MNAGIHHTYWRPLNFLRCGHNGPFFCIEMYDAQLKQKSLSNQGSKMRSLLCIYSFKNILTLVYLRLGLLLSFWRIWSSLYAMCRTTDRTCCLWSPRTPTERGRNSWESKTSWHRFARPVISSWFFKNRRLHNKFLTVIFMFADLWNS